MILPSIHPSIYIGETESWGHAIQPNPSTDNRPNPSTDNRVGRKECVMFLMFGIQNMYPAKNDLGVRNKILILIMFFNANKMIIITKT